MRPSARKVLKVGLKGWPEVRCGASFSAKSRTEMANFFCGDKLIEQVVPALLWVM